MALKLQLSYIFIIIIHSIVTLFSGLEGPVTLCYSFDMHTLSDLGQFSQEVNDSISGTFSPQNSMELIFWDSSTCSGLDSSHSWILKKDTVLNGHNKKVISGFKGIEKILIFSFRFSDPNLTDSFTDREPIRLEIINYKFEYFKQIYFNIENKAHITIRGCEFNHIPEIIFDFDRSSLVYPSGGPDTKIILRDNIFDFDSGQFTYQLNLGQYSNLISFGHETHDDGISQYLIRDITIEGNAVNYIDQTPNTPGIFFKPEYPQRTAIKFFRANPRLNINKIDINHNHIIFDAPNFQTGGIHIWNSSSTNYRDITKSPADKHVQNHTIKIKNNYMRSNSENPHFGIGVQGPFKGVEIIDDSVYNFGLVRYGDYRAFHYDGAIRVYGARPAGKKYSDDLAEVDVKGNIVETRSAGISYDGVKTGTIANNEITLLEFAYWDSPNVAGLGNKYTRLRNCIHLFTGDFETQDRQSGNIVIKGNVASCNGKIASNGIQARGVKDFTVDSNQISDPYFCGIKVDGEYMKEVRYGRNSKITHNSIIYNEPLPDTDLEIIKRDFGAIDIHRELSAKQHRQEKISFEKLRVDSNKIDLPKASYRKRNNFGHTYIDTLKPLCWYHNQYQSKPIMEYEQIENAEYSFKNNISGGNFFGPKADGSLTDEMCRATGNFGGEGAQLDICAVDGRGRYLVRLDGEGEWLYWNPVPFRWGGWCTPEELDSAWVGSGDYNRDGYDDLFVYMKKFNKRCYFGVLQNHKQFCFKQGSEKPIALNGLENRELDTMICVEDSSRVEKVTLRFTDNTEITVNIDLSGTVFAQDTGRISPKGYDSGKRPDTRNEGE